MFAAPESPERHLLPVEKPAMPFSDPFVTSAFPADGSHGFPDDPFIDAFPSIGRSWDGFATPLYAFESSVDLVNG